MTTTALHGCDQAGTTAQRPSNAPNGFVYYDTTLNMPIVRDETNAIWRDLLGRNIAAGVYSYANAGAPTDGTSGTGAAVVAPGCLLIDTTNAKLYINTNTKASPLWTVVGAQTT